MIPKGTPVLSRNETYTGTVCGAAFDCRLEGCRGVRIPVRWDHQKQRTYPCTKGMEERSDGTWKIL